MQEKVMELIEEFEKRLQEFREEYIESKTDFEFEKGETYWSILRDGQVVEFEWRGEEYYVACYEQGNVFKTKEEALFEVEKRKVLHELKQLGRGFIYNRDNWFFYLNKYREIDCTVYQIVNLQHSSLYFDTEDEVWEAINRGWFAAD